MSWYKVSQVRESIHAPVAGNRTVSISRCMKTLILVGCDDQVAWLWLWLWLCLLPYLFSTSYHDYFYYTTTSTKATGTTGRTANLILMLIIIVLLQQPHSIFSSEKNLINQRLSCSFDPLLRSSYTWYPQKRWNCSAGEQERTKDSWTSKRDWIGVIPRQKDPSCNSVRVK